MNSFTIRRAIREDVDQLMNLLYQYIVDFYKRPRPDEKDVQELIHHLLKHPEAGVQFIAESEGRLIGFSTLYFTFRTTRVKKTAILNDLFVSPDARGMKVGEQLFKESLAFTKENGYAGMSWQTAHDNYVGQSLYEKMGGTQTNSEWLHYEINHF
ncbi:N-acetyltransferase family protein [Heyndrickxia sp. NPDC080065]|uniref:GNAT family N-acetyltransferase n=1 Tax=Heyndrickxia sp. NPDC080065 TaxID=3390568 RepID=UPI003D0100C0